MNVKALKPHGGNAKLRKGLKRIQGLINKNRLVEARQLCDRVYSQDVRGAEFLHMYGMTLRACGDLDDALVKIFAAHEEKPTDAKILNSLGLVFLDMKDAETAVTMFKRATSADERLYDAWVNLGTALRGLERFNAAELAFKGAYFLDHSKPLSAVPRFTHASYSLSSADVARLNIVTAVSASFISRKTRPSELRILASVGCSSCAAKIFISASSRSPHALRVRPYI